MFGRHYESTYHGSMRKMGPLAFAVWGYVLSHQKPAQDGEYYVELNSEEISEHIGKTTTEEVESVLAVFQQPDLRSRTPDEEGRRLIRRGQFAYWVVNGKHYQKLSDDEARRAYWRGKKQQQRARSQDVTVRHTSSATMTDGFPASEQEAIEHADFVGVTREFAAAAWHKANSRGGQDARGNPIHNWRSFLKIEQKYDRERLSAKPKTKRPQIEETIHVRSL